jgi:hypothetical protein
LLKVDFELALWIKDVWKRIVRDIRLIVIATDQSWLSVEICDTQLLLGVLSRARKKYGKNIFDVDHARFTRQRQI